MRRVCLLVPHFAASGGVRHIAELAAGVQRRGWDTRIVCVGRGRDADTSLLSEWWSGARGYRGALEVCPLERLSPRTGEVVVSYGDARNEMFMASRLRLSPSVLLVLDWLAFAPERQLAYMRQTNWNVIATSSSWLAENVSRETGRRAMTVGGGVDLDVFYPVDVERPPGRLVVGTLHNAAPGKGWDDVLRVLHRIRTGFGGHLVLSAYGTTPAPAPLNDAALSYVQLPGQAHLREIYSGADVWICTSKTEGFGFVSLEAMACGTPVYTYANGGHSDFNEDGTTGRVLQLLDAEGMADRILEDVSVRGRRGNLASGALHAARRHNWEAGVDRFERVLLAALSGRQ